MKRHRYLSLNDFLLPFRYDRLSFKSETLWVLFGNVGSVVGTIIGIKMLTYALGPAEFGRLILAQTIVLLIGTNLFGPLGQAFMRFWSIYQQQGQTDIFVSTLTYYIRRIFCIVCCFCVLVGTTRLFMKDAAWLCLFVISIVVGAFAGWHTVTSLVLAAARKRKIVALCNTANSFLKPTVAIFCITLVIPNAEVAVTGYLITACLMVAIVNYFYRKTALEAQQKQLEHNLDNNSGKNIKREILHFAWPFFIWGVFGWVLQFCDRWALQSYHGPGVVGAYAVVVQLASYSLVFGSNFLSGLFIPIAYERGGALNSSEAIRSAHKILAIMTGCYFLGVMVLIVVFAFFHQRLIVLISNEEYVRYSYLLPWLTGALAFYFLGQTLSGFGMLAKKPGVYILPIIVSSLVAFTSTFYLSSIKGPEGVVYALGISGFIYALWFGRIAFKLSSDSFRPSKDIY